MQGVKLFLGPFLLKYLHPRIIIIFGTFIAIGGIVASTFVTNFIAFAFLYGVYFGFGMGT